VGRLLGRGSGIDTFDETFSTATHAGAYAFGGCAGRFDDDGDGMIDNDEQRCPWAPGVLPDDAVLGRMARRLVAAPTRDFSIADVVDGIAPCSYRMEQTPTACCNCDGGMYTVPTYAYTTDGYHALISRSLANLGGKGLMPLHRGKEKDGVAYDLGVLEDQLRVSASIAPYTMIWNQPLGVEFIDEQIGVFADHTPKAGKTFEWMGDVYFYHFLGYWPQRQSELEGWYQEWVVDPWDLATTTAIQVRVADNRPAEGETEYWRKVIYREGELDTPIWEDEFGGDDDALVSIDEADVDGDPIIVRLELIGPIGSGVGRVYFAIEDPALGGDVLALTDADWTYRTGVSAFLEDTFNRQKETYIGLRHAYPDCNEDGSVDILDLVCFQQRFTDGDPYADCDQSMSLDILDFVCFVSLFPFRCP